MRIHESLIMNNVETDQLSDISFTVTFLMGLVMKACVLASSATNIFSLLVDLTFKKRLI